MKLRTSFRLENKLGRAFKFRVARSVGLGVAFWSALMPAGVVPSLALAQQKSAPAARPQPAPAPRAEASRADALPASSSRASSVNDLLRLAAEKSESYQAIDQTLQAFEAEIRARDLDLSALLTADLSDTRDERVTLTNQRPLRHRQILETTLEKPFATGTTVSLLLSHQIAEVTPASSDTQLGNWELSVSQDLWRNAFGRGTRLRRESDKAEFQSRRFQALTDKQALLIDVERVYWDLALALKEEQIRLATIHRSEDLERWIRERVRKYAAESSDIYQVQALISQRRLELLENRNRIASLQNEIRELLAIPEAKDFTPDVPSLEIARKPDQLLASSQGIVVSPNDASSAKSSQVQPSSFAKQPLNIVALSSQYRLEQARVEANRVEDTLSPSLQAYASHGSNGINTSAGGAWDQARSGENPATTVGLRLSMDLDRGLQEDRRRAVRLQAEASALQARAEARKSELGWDDLRRQITNLLTQTEEAANLFRFQRLKSEEEHRRYRQGRSTAFQAITFESDAALSELKLYQLFSATRKAESQARAFIPAEEVKL